MAGNKKTTIARNKSDEERTLFQERRNSVNTDDDVTSPPIYFIRFAMRSSASVTPGAKPPTVMADAMLPPDTELIEVRLFRRDESKMPRIAPAANAVAR